MRRPWRWKRRFTAPPSCTWRTGTRRRTCRRPACSCRRRSCPSRSRRSPGAGGCSADKQLRALGALGSRVAVDACKARTLHAALQLAQSQLSPHCRSEARRARAERRRAARIATTMSRQSRICACCAHARRRRRRQRRAAKCAARIQLAARALPPRAERSKAHLALGAGGTRALARRAHGAHHLGCCCASASESVKRRRERARVGSVQGSVTGGRDIRHDA